MVVSPGMHLKRTFTRKRGLNPGTADADLTEMSKSVIVSPYRPLLL